jgi:phage terminase large subunit-like protein
MKNLGADLSAKKINYNANPIDTWNLTNVSYEEDKNANIRPIKTSRSTRRIDGFMALLDAYVVLQDKGQEYEGMI